jgi:hypothetical protein
MLPLSKMRLQEFFNSIDPIQTYSHSKQADPEVRFYSTTFNPRAAEH